MDETEKRHVFGEGDLCEACGKKECGDAFWAMFGAPPGTIGLRLRPGSATFIPGNKDDGS